MPISNDQLNQMQARLAGKPIDRTNRSNTGKAFEAQIQHTLDEYSWIGVLWGHKVDPPVRVVRQGGRQKIIFLSNPWLDFSGIWTKENGRALHFEAKSTATPRLPLGRPDGISTRQIANMRNLAIVGAIVFVLWRIGERRTMLINVDQILALHSLACVSIKDDDCLDVPLSVGLIQIPFETVLRQAAL